MSEEQKVVLSGGQSDEYEPCSVLFCSAGPTGGIQAIVAYQSNQHRFGPIHQTQRYQSSH